jgi:putative lipoprotein
MSRRLTFLAAALVAIVLVVQLALRERRRAPESPQAVAPVADPAPAPGAAPENAAPLEAPARAEPAPERPAIGDAEAPAGTAPDGSRRFMFECADGVWFAVRVVPGEATVFSPTVLGAEVLALPQTEAASGARYAADGVVFSNKGIAATFDIHGRSYSDCLSNPAKVVDAEAHRRGVTFRALGNEPSWLLEIAPQQITLTTAFGARRTEFPQRPPVVAGARTTYRSFLGSQELVVVIDRMPCNDTMSGEAFDYTVAVTFENSTMYGCGRVP